MQTEAHADRDIDGRDRTPGDLQRLEDQQIASALL